MKNIFSIIALIVAVSTSLHAQVDVTFKTMADGQEQYNGQPINVPNYTLTGGGGGLFDSNATTHHDDAGSE